MPKNTEKDIFFDKLHTDIATEFKTDPLQIEILRRYFLNLKWSKEEAIEWTHKRLSKSLPPNAPQNIKPIKRRLERLRLLDLPDVDFKKIIQVTKFDK